MKFNFLTTLLFVLYLLRPNHVFAQLEKVRVVKKVDYASKLVSKSGLDPLYKMTIGFTDVEGKYHQLPQTFVAEDNEQIYKPCLYFDSLNYYIFAKSLDNAFNGYIYKYNVANGFQKEVVFADQAMGYCPFFGKLNKGEPTLYFVDRNAANEKKFIKAYRRAGSWSQEYITMDFDTFLPLYRFVEQVQSHRESYKQYPFKTYNPLTFKEFVPVWCQGDNIVNAKEKPTELYQEVPGSKVEIMNMPWIEAQSTLGECEAYAFAVLFQQRVYSKWQGTEDEIKDYLNPPAESRVSYFGMLKQVHRDQNNKFILSYDDPKYKKNNRGQFERFQHFLDNPSFIIRDGSKPFQNIHYALSHNGSIELSDEKYVEKGNNFLRFLNRVYDQQKVEINKKNILDSLYFYTGMEAKYFNLEKALSKTSYEAFTESLFFDDCQYGIFPFGASVMTYPLDFNRKQITNEDIKLKIIDVLKSEKRPLIISSSMAINMRGEPDGRFLHAVVVCGYKKVKSPKNNKVMEAFKVHNSWGEKWQKENNNGWVDAEVLINSIPLLWSKGDDKPYVVSCALVYLLH